MTFHFKFSNANNNKCEWSLITLEMLIWFNTHFKHARNSLIIQNDTIGHMLVFDYTPKKFGSSWGILGFRVWFMIEMPSRLSFCYFMISDSSILRTKISGAPLSFAKSTPKIENLGQICLLNNSWRFKNSCRYQWSKLNMIASWFAGWSTQAIGLRVQRVKKSKIKENPSINWKCANLQVWIYRSTPLIASRSLGPQIRYWIHWDANEKDHVFV